MPYVAIIPTRLETLLRKVSSFVNPTEFKKVCLPRSKTPVKKVAGPENAKHDDEFGERDNHDGGLLKGCDAVAFEEYEKYVEATTNPHVWYLYHPDWLRGYCGIHEVHW